MVAEEGKGGATITIALCKSFGLVYRVGTGLTWRVMAEKRCATFCNWIYDFETVCWILLKKNPHIANLVFYLWIYLQPPVSITTLAKAKNLAWCLMEKSPCASFLAGYCILQKIIHRETGAQSGYRTVTRVQQCN